MGATKIQIEPVSSKQAEALRALLAAEATAIAHGEQSISDGEILLYGQDDGEPESQWIAHISSTGEVGWTVG